MTDAVASPHPVFLVGSPRSGTTLLQSMLGAHPEVLTLPETIFFKGAWGRLWPHRRWGVVSPRAARRVLHRAADDLGRPVRAPLWPTMAAYSRAFVTLLDDAAGASGASVWLEKSPPHLECIDLITRHVRDVRFVHLVRDGRAVVASFLGAALDLPWDDAVLDHREAVAGVVGHRSDRPHMAGVFEPVTAGPPEGRFAEALSPELQARALEVLLAGGHPRTALAEVGDLGERR